MAGVTCRRLSYRASCPSFSPKSDSSARELHRSQSIADWLTAGQYMVDDALFIVLYYGANVYFVKPYLQGAGGNPLYDNSWTNISVLKH
jgi:hypothetical protein